MPDEATLARTTATAILRPTRSRLGEAIPRGDPTPLVS